MGSRQLAADIPGTRRPVGCQMTIENVKREFEAWQAQCREGFRHVRDWYPIRFDQKTGIASPVG
jgi:hypothetical protein